VNIKRVIITLVIVAGILAVPNIAGSQLTYDQAAERFAAMGCTSCHNGRAAPTFEDMVALFQEWGQKYDNIDDAVANEVVVYGQTYDSYDAMMEQMAKFVGKNLEDIQDLHQFFIEVFQGAGQPADDTGTTTQQDTTTTTTVQEATATTTAQEEQAVEEQPSIAPAVAAGILVAVIIAAAAYMLAKK